MSLTFSYVALDKFADFKLRKIVTFCTSDHQGLLEWAKLKRAELDRLAAAQQQIVNVPRVDVIRLAAPPTEAPKRVEHSQLAAPTTKACRKAKHLRPAASALWTQRYQGTVALPPQHHISFTWCRPSSWRFLRMHRLMRSVF